MIDTHCHLTHERLVPDLDAVIARARDAGLTACVTIGTGCDDGLHARQLAQRYAGMVFFAAGIDPFTAHELGEAFSDELQRLAALLAEGEAVALGEVGLDYHYQQLNSPEVQQSQLAEQLALAEQLDLPVVIHVRDAHDDMVAALAQFPPVRGVIHSFTGGPAEAERYLALGWHIAFNGISTFANAGAIREAAAMVPEDRLLVETDSPYLAPVPVRGRRCEPAFVAHVVQALAKVREVECDALVDVTSRNARRLFRLDARLASSSAGRAT